ncbi:hypothetical protein EYR38_006091 [Pleurotus pulmonarius]|nr:hypothetical protein EYR38_006091 [Pleurotus pulmonarius]
MASHSDPLHFFHSLPPASNVDVRKIKGNLPDAQKQLAANALAYFISTGNTWGADVGQRLNLVEVNILSREGGTQEAQTILEIDVTEEMCNLFGIMHGACAAYLFDPATSSALVALGLVLGIDGSGVSQSMNIIWHKPARRGAKLRLISNSIAIQGRIRSARCEIRDAEGLCVSATHSTINPGRKFKHGGFGTGIADRLVVTDVSIIQNSAEPLRADARVVCELEVTEDMANIAGNMHGGCSIYLVDSCSTLPLSAWLAAQPDRKNDSGVSQSINTVFHAPAPVGTKLRIISTSTMTEGAIFASRCQIWDVINHRLIASGVHLKMIASQPKPKL